MVRLTLREIYLRALTQALSRHAGTGRAITLDEWAVKRWSMPDADDLWERAVDRATCASPGIG